jgi:hypothetical protein
MYFRVDRLGGLVPTGDWLLWAIVVIVALGGAYIGAAASEITAQYIEPRCGIIAIKLPQAFLVYETWSLHLGISVGQQEKLVSEVRKVVASMDTLIDGETSHELSPRITALTVSLNRVAAHLGRVKAYEGNQKPTASIKAEFPLLPGSLADEESYLVYLCKKYKTTCGTNTDSGTVNKPATFHEDVALVEQILNELERTNFNLISKEELIGWSVSQLEGWKALISTCDLTYSKYEEVLKLIMGAQGTLLGKVLTLPCLSDRQVFASYHLVALPIPINDRLWVAKLGTQNIMLVHKTTQESRLVQISDLKALYGTELPFFLGSGLPMQIVPSYLLSIIKDQAVTAPESCPMETRQDAEFYKRAFLLAVKMDTWVVTNYRSIATTLQYAIGATMAQFSVGKGIHLLNIGRRVILQPSIRTFDTNANWGKIGTDMHYENSSYDNLGTSAANDIITLIQESGVRWLDQLIQENVGVSLQTAMTALILIILFSVITFFGVATTLHKCCTVQPKQLRVDKKLERRSKPSLAVQKAVDPFLSGTGTNRW